MSALWPHARALRVLGEELERIADEGPTGAYYLHLCAQATAHYRAADRLDAEIAAQVGNQTSGPIPQPRKPEAPFTCVRCFGAGYVIRGNDKITCPGCTGTGVAPNPRYWTDNGKLHCRHGVILYGKACVTCERDGIGIVDETEADKIERLLKLAREK